MMKPFGICLLVLGLGGYLAEMIDNNDDTDEEILETLIKRLGLDEDGELKELAERKSKTLSLQAFLIQDRFC